MASVWIELTHSDSSTVYGARAPRMAKGEFSLHGHCALSSERPLKLNARMHMP